MTEEHELKHSIEQRLHAIAANLFRGERPDHTLQPTALVNEAWLRLHHQGKVQQSDRSHFLALASRIMREVLVDHARAHRAKKRGGGAVRIEFDDIPEVTNQADVLDVHNALEKMTTFAPRQVQLIELRFFGGLSLDEAAAVLNISERTADKDWKLARAWLRDHLTGA